MAHADLQNGFIQGPRCIHLDVRFFDGRDCTQCVHAQHKGKRRALQVITTAWSQCPCNEDVPYGPDVMVNFCPLNVQKWLATSEADTCRKNDCVKTITLVGDTELLKLASHMRALEEQICRTASVCTAVRNTSCAVHTLLLRNYSLRELSLLRNSSASRTWRTGPNVVCWKYGSALRFKPVPWVHII